MFRALSKALPVKQLTPVRKPLSRPLTSYSIFRPQPEALHYPRRETVIAMVVGKKDDKDAVLLGQRKVTYLDDDDVQEKPYGFPGGHKDPSDKCFVKAAIRELKEETKICLNSLIETNQVKPRVLYEHRSTAHRIFHHKAFVLFDLKEKLATMQPQAADDLIDAKIIPVENIKKTKGLKEDYSVDIMGSKKTLRSTNGLLITTYQSKTFPRTELDDLSSLERNQGGQLLLDAVKQRNENRLRYLLENGALDQTDRDTKEDLVKLATEYHLDDFAEKVIAKLAETNSTFRLR